ncbi:MAG: hypothetical protein PHF18_00995 [Methanosarcina sp.]|uniref:hypothetical protein n=1 Tax=Methanosarcina sp. TaxID=2213 RepID=UPI00261A7427|nr:hypothetical protein [Methanosarcina sp.]MDD3245442.1 hypothetical protein [Methanosarcina sp.]MDD4250015.1 hypothetical protein [Methanosarcina sp.]
MEVKKGGNGANTITSKIRHPQRLGSQCLIRGERIRGKKYGRTCQSLLPTFAKYLFFNYWLLIFDCQLIFSRFISTEFILRDHIIQPQFPVNLVSTCLQVYGYPGTNKNEMFKEIDL